MDPDTKKYNVPLSRADNEILNRDAQSLLRASLDARRIALFSSLREFRRLHHQANRETEK